MLDDEDVDELVPASRSREGRAALAVARGELGFGGIDPGKAGFASLLSPDGQEVFESHPCPMIGSERPGYDLHGMLRIAYGWRGRVALVVIELQRPNVKNGCQGNFSSGLGYGHWLMALAAAGLPHVEIYSQTWKAHYSIGGRRKKGERPDYSEYSEAAREKMERTDTAARRKEQERQAIETVARYYPRLDLRRTVRSTTPCPDKAVSVLLARLARSKHLGHI